MKLKNLVRGLGLSALLAMAALAMPTASHAAVAIPYTFGGLVVEDNGGNDVYTFVGADGATTLFTDVFAYNTATDQFTIQSTSAGAGAGLAISSQSGNVLQFTQSGFSVLSGDDASVTLTDSQDNFDFSSSNTSPGNFNSGIVANNGINTLISGNSTSLPEPPAFLLLGSLLGVAFVRKMLVA